MHSDMTPAAKSQAVFTYIWKTEESDGGLWICARDPMDSFLLISLTNRLVRIASNDADFTSWLLWKYGLNVTDGLTRHVIEALRATTRITGAIRDLKRFTYYDTTNKLLYVSKYDGTCWQLDGQRVTVVKNGTGCLFLDDDGGKPETDEVVPYPHGILLDKLVSHLNYVTDGGMTADQQRLALTVWIFMIAFPDLMETKPMLLVEGAPGSGKTTAIRLIKYAVHGDSKPMTLRSDDESDFFIQLLTSPIALLDNVDNFIKWLQDAVCAYVTGAEVKKRKLYTDAGSITIRPASFLAIASKNPLTFRRDDVADRCILVRLARRDDNSIVGDLLRYVDKYRAELLGEWLYYLNQIVALIREGAGKNVRYNHRMADFAYIAHLVGRVTHRTPEEVEDMLHALQLERESFSTENDVLVDLLDVWLSSEANNQRDVTAGNLHAELCAIAKLRQREYKSSPMSLAHRLTRDIAVGKHFIVVTTPGRAGIKNYRIRRAT